MPNETTSTIQAAPRTEVPQVIADAATAEGGEELSGLIVALHGLESQRTQILDERKLRQIDKDIEVAHLNLRRGYLQHLETVAALKREELRKLDKDIGQVKRLTRLYAREIGVRF